jgi:hypothetical protein
MTAHHFIRSVGRWLTRHRRAGSCGTRRDAGMNRQRNFDRFTERARTVMQLAQEEAQRLQHNYIGTEHLLLGLLREGQGIGAGVLESFGLSLQEVRAHIIQVLNEQGKPKLVCSFCRKQQDQVQRLVAGPGGVSVCDECVAALSHGSEAPQEEQGLRCSFCGKQQRQVPYLAVGPHGVNICQACLVLCQQIIAEEGPHQA